MLSFVQIIADKDAGQWGSWSEWSECSSTCKGGTKSRYRFCDSPSPKYGAKYCEVRDTIDDLIPTGVVVNEYYTSDDRNLYFRPGSYGGDAIVR